MTLLHLIRHAQSRPVPGTPPESWGLTPEGEAQAQLLAAGLLGRPIAGVVTSREPKARKTGQIIAEHLGVPIRTAEGLHEQVRTGTPYFASQEEFQAAVQSVFERPTERTFGQESADEAHARFSAAVGDVLRGQTGEVVIVAHGTVNALLVVRANGLDPLTLWRSLAMPDRLTLGWPGLQLLEHVTPEGAARSAG